MLLNPRKWQRGFYIQTGAILKANNFKVCSDEVAISVGIVCVFGVSFSLWVFSALEVL